TLINGITYQNNSQDPTAGTRTVTPTQIRDTGGGTDVAAVSIASVVNVVPVNDAPTLTATGVGGAFTEGAGLATGTPVDLYNAPVSATVEAAQAIRGLTVTVSDLQDGASEQIDI